MNPDCPRELSLWLLSPQDLPQETESCEEEDEELDPEEG